MLWSEALKTALARLNKTASDVLQDRKAAAWKVAVAAQLKTVSTAGNGRLAEQPRMGAPDGVSRYVSELRRGQRKEAEKIRREITDIRV